MPAGQERKSSPWTWIAGGCLTLLIVGVLVIGGGVFMVSRWARNLEADMKDPDRRDAKAREVLGTERLPDGYHAVAAVTIPLLADIAVLSNAPPATEGPEAPEASVAPDAPARPDAPAPPGAAAPDGPGGGGLGMPPRRWELGERGLVYIRFLRVGQNMQEIENYLSGKTNDAAALARNHINLDVDEVLQRGVIEGEPTLMYLVQRGDVNFEGASSGRKLVTMVLPRCGGGRKMPLALWYSPDVAAAKPDDPASLAGTVGDEAEIRKFMGQFKLCP